MTLSINVDTVRRVKIGNTWMDVARDSNGASTFVLDSYEFVAPKWFDDFDPSRVLHKGGQSGVCATGFSFEDASNGTSVSGPLTAIEAVVHD